MTRLFRAFVLAALAAFALPALADAAPATSRGIVVQRDTATGAVVLASPNGVLHRVKLASPGKLKMGALIQVRGSKISVIGRARSAKVHGLVMRRSPHAYALASNGAVVAVATPTTAPPPAGQEVTATVQVTPTQLSDDDGDVQVSDNGAPTAELHGTVLSQDAAVLRLTVPGFSAGLAIALVPGQTIPALPVGTPVDVRVSIGPGPGGVGIVLTLVSLQAEQSNSNQQGGGDGSFVKADGQITALTEAGPVGGAAGSLTVLGEHGSVTFVIPAGFGPTGAVVGDTVEARGTASTTAGGNPTLVKLEGGGDNQGDSSDDNGDSGTGNGSTSNSQLATPANGTPGSNGHGDHSSGNGDNSGSND
jgi:copper(I)-binding protein